MQTYRNQMGFNIAVSNIDFVVYRNQYRKWKIENLSNKTSYILGFATDGGAEYTIDGQTTEVKKGNLLFFQKGQMHSAKAKPDTPWTYYSVAFDIVFLDEQSKQDISALPTILSVKLFEQFDEIFRELNTVWTLKPAGYLLKCRSLILDILYRSIAQAHSPAESFMHSDVIEEIRDYLIQNYTETYQIKELAQKAGLSPSHFRMLFKKYTGKTVVQYQNELKINKARDLLASGMGNITETAYSVGYNDIYYFSRQFKKITGVSPSAYVKQQLL